MLKNYRLLANINREHFAPLEHFKTSRILTQRSFQYYCKADEWFLLPFQDMRLSNIFRITETEMSRSWPQILSLTIILIKSTKSNTERRKKKTLNRTLSALSLLSVWGDEADEAPG